MIQSEKAWNKKIKHEKVYRFKTCLLLFLVTTSGLFTQCENAIEPNETVSSFQVVHYDALPGAIQAEVNVTENALKTAYIHKKINLLVNLSQNVYTNV